MARALYSPHRFFLVDFNQQQQLSIDCCCYFCLFFLYFIWKNWKKNEVWNEKKKEILIKRRRKGVAELGGVLISEEIIIIVSWGKRGSRRARSHATRSLKRSPSSNCSCYCYCYLSIHFLLTIRRVHQCVLCAVVATVLYNTSAANWCTVQCSRA